MNPVRSNDATSVVFELLEPRLLLSTSVTPGLEAPGFGVPAYVDVVLPDHKLDTDTVSACLREAHADLEAGEDGVIDLVGSLQVAGVRVNDAGELQVYVHVNAVGNLGTQYRFLFARLGTRRRESCHNTCQAHPADNSPSPPMDRQWKIGNVSPELPANGPSMENR
jgi:hypothetical protein